MDVVADILERLLSARTRIVAFPWMSNAVRTIAAADRIGSLAREAGALAGIDAASLASGAILSERPGSPLATGWQVVPFGAGR